MLHVRHHTRHTEWLCTGKLWRDELNLLGDHKRAVTIATDQSAAVPASPSTTAPAQPDRDRPFRIDHLMADLKGRSVRGGAMTLAAQLLRFVLQVGSTAVLARLLTPEDYGLLAMVAVFTGFIGLFRDLGLSMATVQRAEITHAEVSTLFWINVAVSLLLVAVTMTLAPIIARFYGDPRLVKITVAISTSSIFGGLAAQHIALLRRQMRFHLLAVLEVAPLFVAVITGIVMALLGARFWALVTVFLVEAAGSTVLAWALSKWTPGLPRPSCDIRSLLRFGGNIVGCDSLNFLSRNADNFLIGWYWGAGALGLYTRAYTLLMVVVRQATAPVGQIMLPTLSRVSDDAEQFRHIYLRAINMIAWTTGIIAAWMAACSHELVLMIFGQDWLGAVGPFRALAVLAFLQPLSTTIGWIFVSRGRTDRMFNWAAATSPIIVSSFLIGLPYGVTGVAVSYAVIWSTVVLPWSLYYAFRGTSITIMAFLLSLAVPMMSSVVALLIAWGATSWWSAANPLASLAVKSIAALATIGAIALALPSARRELLAIVRLARHLPPLCRAPAPPDEREGERGLRCDR